MISKLSFDSFLKKHQSFVSIKTWTKQKYELRKEFISYLEEHEHVFFWTHYRNIEFKDSVWSFNISIINDDKKGHLSKYRGVKVLRIIVSRGQSDRGVYCLPII